VKVFTVILQTTEIRTIAGMVIYLKISHITLSCINILREREENKK
jgi:hypothetical protein